MNYSAAQAGNFRDRGAGGLACPSCGATAHNVSDSRARNGTIYRRRVCRNLHRFSTVEAVESFGRVARLNGLVAALDALPAEDLALVARLAGRLGHETADPSTSLGAGMEGR